MIQCNIFIRLCFGLQKNIFKMSGRPAFRRKPGNCNKPLRRDREQQERDFSTTLHRSENEGSSSSCQQKERLRPPPLRPPPGLKGKAIGMWYRDQQLKKSKEQEPERLEVSLDPEKRDEIENLLATVASERARENADSDTSFQKSFLSKINVSFEEKINKVKNVEVAQNPAIDAELYNKLTRKLERSSRYREMLDFRQKLPSYKKKDEIVQLIEKNQVVVLFGETGI